MKDIKNEHVSKTGEALIKYETQISKINSSYKSI
jgi:hypothetical protein